MPDYIEYNGEKKTISEWASHTGIDVSVIRMRLSRNWPVERALTQTVEQSRARGKKYAYQGMLYTLVELAEMAGLSATCIRNRIGQCQNIDLVVDTPVYEWRDVREEASRENGHHKT